MAADVDQPVCRRCGMAVRIVAEQRGLRFYVCDHCDTRGAYSIPKRLAPLSSEHPQMVIWRDGERRCELWAFEDGSVLRVYDGVSLMREERFPKGHGWQRAEELRTAYGEKG